jgi:hypothetical protein
MVNTLMLVWYVTKLLVMNTLMFVWYACVFAAEIWWGCFQEFPGTTLGVTVVTFLAIEIPITTRVRAARKQRLHADVYVAIAVIEDWMKRYPTDEIDSNYLRDRLRDREQGAKQQKRFDERVWPLVIRYYSLSRSENVQVRVLDPQHMFWKWKAHEE